MILLYSFVESIHPSQEMISQCIQKLNDHHSITQVERMGWDDSIVKRVILKDGQCYDYAFNRSIDMGPDYQKWAVENISQDAMDFRVVSTPPGAPIKGPHTDHTRKYTMIYLLESGGDDHETCFYRDVESDSLALSPGTFRDDMSKVEKVAGIRIPLKTWTLLNAHVLHGVENIPCGRVALQISFDCIDHLELQQPRYFPDNH